MKKIIKIIAIITLSLVVISCGNTTEKKEVKTRTEKTDIKKTELKETHQAREDKVLLNNGKRWTANPETTKGIQKMLATIKRFSVNENASNYKDLKATLEEQFADIFEKCTMKGESHNQLHNYLKPMLSMFDGLASEEAEVRKNSVKTLYKHVSQYGNYFE